MKKRMQNLLFSDVNQSNDSNNVCCKVNSMTENFSGCKILSIEKSDPDLLQTESMQNGVSDMNNKFPTSMKTKHL